MTVALGLLLAARISGFSLYTDHFQKACSFTRNESYRSPSREAQVSSADPEWERGY
jgi:hypothetical protein